jgi:tetratricopeptide (TPR) repeat protein
VKEHLAEYFQEAVRLKDSGDLNGAKSILEDLTELDPLSPSILATLGDVYWDMQDLPNALVTFRKAIELKPCCEPISLSVFSVLWNLRRFDEALSEAQRFLPLSDSDEYQSILQAINDCK